MFIALNEILLKVKIIKHKLVTVRAHVRDYVTAKVIFWSLGS